MTKTYKRLFNKRLALIMIAIAMVFSLFSVASPTYAGKQKIIKENKTLYVKSSSANVRSGSSTKHKVVKTFKKNTKLSSYEKTTASGTFWYHIKWTENKKSKYGWISSTTVTTTAPTTVKKENKTLYVKGTKANLRSTTSTKGKVVKTYGKNTKLSSYETKKTNNQTWYHIKFKVGKSNKTAWVISTEVTSTTPSTVKKENKTLYVNVSKANVRSGASTKNKVVAQFNKNTKLSSYETKKVGKETWYHIKWTSNKKTKTGWISSTTVTTKAPAPTIKKENKTLYVTSTSATAHSSYSKNSKKITVLAKHTKLSGYEKTIVGDKDWYHVKFIMSNGKTYTGWIEGSNLSTRPDDGWKAPVLKSKYTSDKNQAYKIFENELGFKNGGYIYGIEGKSYAINVNYNVPSHLEVILSFNMWDSVHLYQSYRIPIVSKQLFKFYFGESNATKLVGYFDKNDIPEKFTMNNRVVKVKFVEKTGTLVLEVGKPGVKW